LQLRAEGGFTAEAEQVLDKELARRNISPDEMRRYVPSHWLDKAKVGTVGVLALENGKRITAEVVGLNNEEGDQLVVEVISRDTPHRNGHGRRRVIPVHEITSFEPQPHLAGQWPYCDLCRDRTFSLPRFVLMTTIFLCLMVGSLPLFLLLRSTPYGLQEASIITYTLFELFFTFARTGSRGGPDLPPFKFKCPAVQTQIPRLLWRHLGFLVALFALQTAMLATRTHLPEWWNMRDSKGATPFDLVLILVCFGLGFAQVLTSRSLLDRAHREFAA
jgi:hypothetical protein